MNKDKWNALPADIQKIIAEINSEWADQTRRKPGTASDMAGHQVLSQPGGQIIGVDKKEQARWKKAVAPIIDEYVAESEREGH